MARMSRVLLAAASVIALAAGASLRAAPVQPEQSEVAKLRAKLQKVSDGMVKLLDPKGSLANTRIAPEMRSFAAELKQTLNNTATEKNTTKALKQLKDAQAGVQALTKDMTLQQTRLMKEGEDQTVNLLLGVLMTRQKDPMAAQLEVLKDKDFAQLAVVKGVLAAKDSKTPLFQQAAAWLDKHGGKPAAGAAAVGSEIPDKLKAGKDGKPDVSPIVNALTVRLNALETHQQREADLHAQEMKELDAAEKKEAKKAPKRAHRIELMKKKEARKYAKQEAMSKHDVASMKDAIAAIKTGDMKALGKAQAALAESLKAMQAQSGGFLYLIQLGHRAASRDCPYCAAQCFDKCHASGKSYTTCLTDCADAGK